MAPQPVDVRGDPAFSRRSRSRAGLESARHQIAQHAGQGPGMIARDNPELPMAFIEDVLVAQEESKAGLSQPYAWGVIGR